MIVTYKLGLEFCAILSLRTIDHWAGLAGIRTAIEVEILCADES